MNNPGGFSFPPPPPPPPTSQQQQQGQQSYGQTGGYSAQYGSNYNNGQRGGRGGGGHRGRGRGYGNRGGRGGHYMSQAAAPPSTGYAPMNYAGYQPQSMGSPSSGMPTPQFNAPTPTPNFQNARNPVVPSPQPYAQAPAAHAGQYSPQPGYGAAYTPSNTQQATPYHAMATNHHAAPPMQSPMMGPPMRWGFENPAPLPGTFPGNQRGNHRGNQRGSRQANVHPHHAAAGGRPMHQPNKRDHNSAFGKPQSAKPRIPAPPPVPSFGSPLPSKPPPPADATRKPKKKKRKHNQLGLTPKTEEHESSDEEDDADEESRLASGGSDGPATLQISYRGRTSTLQSAADIAAWIAERKKKFPTQARVAEKQKVMEEAKKAREEVQRQNQARKQEARQQQKDARAQKAHEKQSREEPPAPAGDPIDAAEKAKQKADKLRRKLMKEQKRVEKAEADAERARMRVEQLQKGVASGLETREDATQPASGARLDTDRGLPSDSNAKSTIGADTGSLPQSATSSGVTPGVPDDAESAISSDSSDSDDWTSSSGSEDSSSDSEDSDDGSAPEQATSRREGPERVPPPPREAKKAICHNFARRGHCIRGNKCKYLHETPERGAKPKQQPVPEKQGRKGLLQALLDRQKGDDDRKVMEAIMWLGENGKLDAPEGEQAPHPAVVDNITTTNSNDPDLGTGQVADEHGSETVPSASSDNPAATTI
ncbi:CCCH zinc finger protein [Aspergillus candidus]|uniref:C3H1-type domain-containing protein n=1 Tax=Aspergillus candidus TaxID=41067 RepID=A0A2I2F9P3_ASPCN|nr:hypothetical protein BDW47DRAFT_39560 [Aspergillus candidus]PLB37350.1 hypothetical protein BDW47DRAFT_39560 [Aspergillus candidus]